MAEYIVTDSDLTAVADAIRAKGKTTEALAFPDGFVGAVEAIETGNSGYTVDDLATNNISGEITITASTIENRAFSCRTKITKVTTTNLKSYSYIGKYAFADCTSLASIDIKAVSNIGNPSEGAFYNCKALTEVTMGCSGFDNSVFENCTSLKRAVFPYCKQQNNHAFRGCTALEYFDMGMSTSTDDYDIRVGNSFQNCTNLKTFVIRQPFVIPLSTVTAFNGTPFASGGTGGTLYVPEALISEYQANANWATILGYDNNKILAI